MTNDTARNASTVLKYNPQLDGLRFCAVFFVVSYHWLPSFRHLEISSFLGGMINFFFVLSSYLITRILFSARDKGNSLGVPKLKVITVFLLRRTIRIFPAYYLFLLLVILIPTIGIAIKEHPGMYFSYLANYQMYLSHDFPSVAAHIWTLAVEEQFYLLWPLVIFFVPQRHLLKTFLFIIIASPVLRAVCYYPAAGVPQAVLTQYCADPFAIGALLAYKYSMPDKEIQTISKYLNIALYAGLPIGVLIIATRSHYFSFVFNRLLFSLISMKLIEGAISGYRGYMGKFLEHKAVCYIGRISYGIYLYHLLVPVLFWRLYKIVKQYGKTNHASFFATHRKAISKFEVFLVSEIVCFVIYALLVLVIASLSWKFMEQPLNKLKVSYNTGKKPSLKSRLKQHIA
jgi:peptidoglycan/LPS O-acetylase OafA/YrhL